MKIEAPRPPWRDEYLHDLPALQQYAKEVTAWQRSSSDPFERCDAELWSRVSAPEACAIFPQLNDLLPVWERDRPIECRARRRENEARRESGLPPLSMADFRALTVRRTWPAENHQLVATTLTQQNSHRQRCVARISPSQTVDPSLISLNNSDTSTEALKIRRARLLCRAAKPPSNQLMRICGFKSAIGEPCAADRH
jgi:hypothetical protein